MILLFFGLSSNYFRHRKWGVLEHKITFIATWLKITCLWPQSFFQLCLTRAHLRKSSKTQLSFEILARFYWVPQNGPIQWYHNRNPSCFAHILFFGETKNPSSRRKIDKFLRPDNFFLTPHLAQMGGEEKHWKWQLELVGYHQLGQQFQQRSKVEWKTVTFPQKSRALSIQKTNPQIYGWIFWRVLFDFWSVRTRMWNQQMPN